MKSFTDILRYVRDHPGCALFLTPPFYPDGESWFFKNPLTFLEATNATGIRSAFDAADEYVHRGYYAVVSISYEAGYVLNNLPSPKITNDPSFPLIRIIIYERKNAEQIHLQCAGIDEFRQLMNSRAVHVRNLIPGTGREEYIQAIRNIRAEIRKGNTYQVNYTIRNYFDFSGDAMAFFLSLIFRQSAQYCAFIHDPGQWILSVSPELFFHRNGNTISCQPMKGTIRRGNDQTEDLFLKKKLIRSAKDRAENVMIVDLIRNDLGRLALPGKVKVTSLFDVTNYESLFQMTSGVEAAIPGNTSTQALFHALFPCGSVTGAPKISTMKIIDRLEAEPRGTYCGALGWMHSGKAIFNVPIRTITISKKNGKGVMGSGSGIVWDSDPEKEYEETLLKSRFLTQPYEYFELFESMLVEDGCLQLLKDHLHRLKKAASFFLFSFNLQEIKKEIKNSIKKIDPRVKTQMKIMLSKWGNFDIITAPVSEYAGPLVMAISDLTISSSNRFQYYKTTRRDLYETEFQKYRANGCFDVVFLNERGEIAEGSRTNVFVRKRDTWLTPPLHAGILGGVYRNHLLSTLGKVHENTLFPDDLLSADEILLTNAVRKAVKVTFERSDYSKIKKRGPR